MMLKIGGQLSKTHYKELLKTLPGYFQKQDKGKNPHQFEMNHCLSFDEKVLSFPAGKGCSFQKTMDFCHTYGLPYEYTDYGVSRWLPGQKEEYAGSTVQCDFLEEFVKTMDFWNSLEDLPPYLNADEEDNFEKAKSECAKHALKTGVLDKYELMKVWFKNYLPMDIPRFEWID